MRGRLIFLFCSGLLSVVSMKARAEVVSVEVARQAYFHAANLLREFPPDRYYVISFGRSTPVINAALRDLLGSQDAVDRYLVELPIENFNTSDEFFDRGPGGRRDRVLERMFPAGAATRGREPVMLRVLMFGHSIMDFADAVHGARRHGVGLPERIHSYLVHSPRIVPTVFPLGQRMGGRVVALSDPLLPETLTLGWDSRDDAGNPGRFTRFRPFTPADLLALGWRLWENPRWPELDSLMRELIRPGRVLTLAPNTPTDHIEAARQSLESQGASFGSLYELYPWSSGGARDGFCARWLRRIAGLRWWR